MIYYQFAKSVTEGPNGTTVTVKLPEIDGQFIGNELGTINGITYLSLPDDAVLPEQLPEINCLPMTMTEELKEQLRAVNPFCGLVSQQIRAKIRERYDGEDEMYFARISVGVLMGAYTFQPGEQQAVLDYGAFVEGIRQWGRDERAKVGL